MSLKPLNVSSPRSQQSSPSSQPFSSLPTLPNTNTNTLAISPRSAFVPHSPPLSAGGAANRIGSNTPPRSTSNIGLGLGLPKSPRLGVGTARLALNDDEMAQVTNPQELTSYVRHAWKCLYLHPSKNRPNLMPSLYSQVDKLLNDLEARFDGMSADVLSRLTSLSTRVDSLETSISDLMSGNASVALGSGTESGASSPTAEKSTTQV